MWVKNNPSSSVNDLKTQLRKKHGSVYTALQYAMWAEMLADGGHDSMDEPPMFGSRKRGSGGASNMTEAFTALSGSIANVLFPKQLGKYRFYRLSY